MKLAFSSVLATAAVLVGSMLIAQSANAASIVVYGDSLAGVAAAAKAAANSSGQSVVLIVPGTGSKLGGLATAGAQNFFDLKKWTHNGITDQPQNGTYGYYYNTFGQFYNPDKLASQMLSDLNKYSNLQIIWNMDLESVASLSSPYRISSVGLRNVYKDASGITRFGTTTQTVPGTVFIDASDDGRLYRLSNYGGTTGRADWPSADLKDASEQSPGGTARQQAATLMFKIKGVDYSRAVANGFQGTADPKTGARGLWGGSSYISADNAIKAFNKKYASLSAETGFAIKPMNLAENGSAAEQGLPSTNDEWWVNALLEFNVDGRACERDRSTPRFPSDMRSDAKTIDQAYLDAKNIVNSTDFLNAMRAFPGFENITITGTADMLYLRETVHTSKNAASNGNGTENSNYALTANASVNAGTSPTTGQDAGNYNSRIGLSFYNLDINAYEPSDMFDTAYGLTWPVTPKLRPDLALPSSPNPVYVPYTSLTTNYVANLLLPGYATGTSSFAWSEERVLPNLGVLGDAAGVAAGYAVTHGVQPLYLTSTDIASIQSTLVNSANAKIDKW